MRPVKSSPDIVSSTARAEDDLREGSRKPWNLLLRGLILGALLSALVYVRLHDPLHSLTWVRCAFHTLTGLYCPGCGGLRATHQMLNGNLRAALDYNAFYVLLVPILAGGVLSLLVPFRLPSLPRAFRHPLWIKGFLVLYGAFWVARNLPYPLFTVLAP